MRFICLNKLGLKNIKFNKKCSTSFYYKYYIYFTINQMKKNDKTLIMFKHRK